MSEIRLRSDLELRGISAAGIRRMVRSGSLERVRRGAYAFARSDGGHLPPESAAIRDHRRRLAAASRQLTSGAVVSHASAAVLHGLPLWNDQLALLHYTRGQRGGGRTRAGIRLHGLPLEDSDVVVLDGVAVTSAARTALDLGCQPTLARAVAVGDAVLRARLATREELHRQLIEASGRTGIGAARRAFGLLDPRSENAGESVSRIVFLLNGLPVPELQYEVFSPEGRLVGRTDTVWHEFRTLGEFDGRIKYGRSLKPGQRVEEVVWAEKLREDDLREQGWEVVRWTWQDLRDPVALTARIRRAFERGERRWR